MLLSLVQYIHLYKYIIGHLPWGKLFLTILANWPIYRNLFCLHFGSTHFYVSIFSFLYGPFEKFPLVFLISIQFWLVLLQPWSQQILLNGGLMAVSGAEIRSLSGWLRLSRH